MKDTNGKPGWWHRRWQETGWPAVAIAILVSLCIGGFFAMRWTLWNFPESKESVVAAYTALMGVFAVVIGALAHGMAKRAQERRQRLAAQLDRIGGLHQELRQLRYQFKGIRVYLDVIDKGPEPVPVATIKRSSFDTSTPFWEKHADAGGSTAIYKDISDAYKAVFEVNNRLDLVKSWDDAQALDQTTRHAIRCAINDRYEFLRLSVDRIGEWIEEERKRL